MPEGLAITDEALETCRREEVGSNVADTRQVAP